MKIGIQASSLKPLLRTSQEVRCAFQKMSALGCSVVQLQWIDPSVPLEEIRSSLAESGLISVSVQDFYQTVEDNFDYYAKLNALTGGRWLCVSRIPQDCKSRAGLDVLIARFRKMQDALTPLGQTLCFHPVSADFAAVAGMDAVQYLLDAMPELSLCLDLFHLNRNCADMPGFIRRYGSRICMVHFKDAIVETLVPAVQGDICWSGVVAACLDAGVPYAFVEQEHWDRDPYECLQEAITWLEEEIDLTERFDA